MSLVRRAQQWGTFAQVWHLFDAKWQDPFVSAPTIAKYLKGAHKPFWHTNIFPRDHVVVINSKEIALRGNEWVKRVYFHHDTYHGGATWTRAYEVHKIDRTMIVNKAVWKALGNNIFRRYGMKHLHIYEDDKVPDEIMANISHQIRQDRPIPVAIDEIPKEIKDNFPQIVVLPRDYVKD